MGMLPQNTMVVTMMCVLVAVEIDHTLTTSVTRFSFLITCLAHEMADYVKYVSYCLINLLYKQPYIDQLFHTAGQNFMA